MSSRNDRKGLELTDLPLESVIKVFQFLDSSIKDDLLDIDVIEKKIQKYALLEQYFICEYGTFYYSKQKVNALLKGDYFKIYDEEQIQRIKENAENFILGIEGMRESLKKLAKNHKRKYGDFTTFKLPEDFIEEPIDFRIPFYFVPQTVEDFEKRFGHRSDTKSSFKEEVHIILKDFLQEEDIELFFDNTFYYPMNPYPIRLLYLTINKRTEFGKRMHQLYTSYSEYYKRGKSEYENYYIQHQSDLANQIKDKEIKRTILDSRGLLINTGKSIELTEVRSRFYPKIKDNDDKKQFIKEIKSFRLPEITKEHFTKTLYNSFVHIREGYIEKIIENPKLSLEEYLKTTSTNKLRD